MGYATQNTARRCAVRRPDALVRLLHLVVALAVLCGSLVMTASPSAAAAGITLNKAAPADVLVGENITYTLTAANPAANPDAVAEFNLSFRDVLPFGVTYVAGSTRPSQFGEPTVITAASGQQTLIWRNVADLGVGSTAALTFSAAVDETVNPVGQTLTNTAGGYVNSNPRFVPRFTPGGLPIPLTFTQSATDTAATRVTALEIVKTEPSPEGELLRGIHDHTTVYTLAVTNNEVAASNGATLVDFIPAGLEFLGCGGLDNGTTGPEYPGAPSLAATPEVTDCVTPASVTTVVNPTGLPAGVYTRVLWQLGDLAAGATATIAYRAGIPQRANTATWPGATPGGIDQAANLDNNTGASTRELSGEGSLTNTARVEGTYQGPVFQGGSPVVGSQDSVTVTAEDVRLLKSTDAPEFSQGGEVRYTLTIDTSEYADGTDIVVTDRLPNGMCPLSDTTNYVAGAPAECAPAAEFAPSGATISNVVQNADGTFDLTFSNLDIAANGTAVIEYSARMRTVYTGGPDAGDPTSSGDSFTNTAALTGETTPPDEVQAPEPDGTEPVTDESSTTISAGGPTLTKSVLPDVTPMDCSIREYQQAPPIPVVTFVLGSRVCFQLRVQFPSGVATRDVTLTDFLPDQLSYELGSATAGPDNTVPVVVDESDTYPIFQLGNARRELVRDQPAGACEP